MNILAPTRPRRNGHNPDKGLLGRINSDGYEVVYTMSSQLGNLEDICDDNAKEDAARGELGAILRLQERGLIHLGKAGQEALDLNRRAQRKLALVDTLDAFQGLDRREPVKQATKRNREAHAAGRRIIAESERPELAAREVA